MIATVVTCDICKQLKGETNHWLVAVTDPPTAEEPGSEGIAFGPSDAPFDPAMKIEHICGEACAHKRLSQYLSTLNSTTNERQS